MKKHKDIAKKAIDSIGEPKRHRGNEADRKTENMDKMQKIVQKLKVKQIVKRIRG